MNCSCCCDEHSTLEIKMKKGESLGFAFTFTEQGVPVDLTNSEMILEIRERVIDDGNYLISKTVDVNSDPEVEGAIIDAVNGKFFFKINKEDIENLSTFKPYFFAIYHRDGSIRDCISANNWQLAKFLVFNP